MNKIKIAPSILSANFANLQEDLKILQKSGADIVHLDVMDGSFVPNITFGAGLIRDIRPHTQLPFDVHLMIEEPERYIKSFVESGADSISFHVEASKHIHKTIYSIKELGCLAGIAVNPGTSITNIEPILEDIDYVVIMTVNPGFGGQKFITSTLNKIAALRKNFNLDIMVDGGINPITAQQVISAGANILVAGSNIFSSMDKKRAIDNLRNWKQG